MITRRKSVYDSHLAQQQPQRKEDTSNPARTGVPDGRKTPGPRTSQPRKNARIPHRRISEAAPGMPQNGAHQTHVLQNGLDADDIPKFKGYRIIEIDHFLQWAAYSQFMHSKHCPGGLLKPYQEYVSGCYSTFAMKCSKCSAIITRSSENYIHHNKLMNRLVKGTVQMSKDYDEMSNFMESLEIPFVTREEFTTIKSQMQLNSSLEDQSSLQKAVEELERASVASKRKRHGSCKYHYEVLKVYLNKKMRKIEENLQLSVNDSVALAVNAHLKNVAHVQLVSNSSNGSCPSGSNATASTSSESNRFGAGFSNGPPAAKGNTFNHH
ncbi:AAEL008870-PA [Aedes aegypti]|uniref:AAEL008870-PA n=1 Tax=Aedes aegypti TaxID=7159 RepID=Q16XI1_AEDAE|nr:AAEL008870-PA [Aedes aegypti]